MKVLILGSSGMLGHKLRLVLREQFEVWGTLRRELSPRAAALFDAERTMWRVSAGDKESVVRALDRVSPDVVVNCIGVVKQLAGGKDPVTSIAYNSLFPHVLANLCVERGIRVIHLSTDCVFTGRRGSYREEDESDAIDMYGRSKALGELRRENCLTLRTSIIGRELSGAHGLLEWFLGERGRRVNGYRRAVFSGLTTHALSVIIARIIADAPELHGVCHVAATPISKYDLLSWINRVLACGSEIVPDDGLICDRSLDGSRFVAETGIESPSWDDMIRGLRDDPTPYDEIRADGSPRNIETA